MTLFAHAKVNLTLEVLGRRDNGYHEIVSVMQTISLADEIHFEVDGNIYLECDDRTLLSDENLVLRAARLLKRETGYEGGARVLLRKRIPVAAGLGGGSSDAAATLRGLNQLWGLNLSLCDLARYAERLGTDVPFFLLGGTVLAEGRGERLTSLNPLPKSWLVLFTPSLDIPNKTEEMYSLLSNADFTSGQWTKAFIKSLKSNKLETAALFNTFERVAWAHFPLLEEYRRVFVVSGAADTHLAGSGPTLFSLVESEADGRKLLRALRKGDIKGCLTRTVGAAESLRYKVS